MQVGTAMAVLSQMERLGVAPDAESYDLALRVLLQASMGADRVLNVVNVMRQNGIIATPRTFRWAGRP
jgi:hypothetical protein